MFANGWQNGGNVFFRWFYDQTQKKARIDSLGEWMDEEYWSTQIFDHTQQIHWTVFYQVDFETCFKAPMNWSLPVPNFQGAQYLGQAQVGYEVAYHWLLTKGPFNMQYFDRVTDRMPVRIDFDDSAKHIADTLLFTEFDAGAQSTGIFTLAPEIVASCNTVTTTN